MLGIDVGRQDRSGKIGLKASVIIQARGYGGDSDGNYGIF